MSVLPLLLNRLDSSDVVVYTYAAVALDRILSMRVGDSTILMYAPRIERLPFFSFTISAGFHRQTFSHSLLDS